MQDDQRISITPVSAELAAGLDDVNRRLRAVLARGGGFRRRVLARRWAPPRVPCVGRDDELADLSALLVAGRRHVCVCGPRGIGKTTLLYQAASRGVLGADTVSDCDGVLWPGRAFRFADDVLRELFAGCYQVAVDTVVPEDTVRDLLRPVRALVVLDGMSLSEDELRAVVEAMPASRFVITTIEPGFGHPLPVGGLSLDDGVRLVTDRLGAPLPDDEVRHLIAVWEDYEGHPGRLAELAGYLRTAGTRGIPLRVPTRAELPLVVPRVIAGLDPSPHRTLAVLAAVPDAEWGTRLLTALSGTAERPGPRRLTEQSLASGHGGRYRLAPHVSDHLPADVPIPVDQIATRLTVWLNETARPLTAAGEVDVIERTIEAVLADEQHLVTMVLARDASELIMNSANWSAWRRILWLGLRAARAVGSVADQLYFTYGLAAWATANRRTEEAVRLLEEMIGASKENPDAAEQAAALRERIEGAAFERGDLLVPSAAPGLVARLTPDALRTAKMRIGQLPGVQPFLRLAAENPVLVRIGIGVVTAACAAAVALAALPHDDPAAAQTLPAPHPSNGPAATGTTPFDPTAAPGPGGQRHVGGPNQAADPFGTPAGTSGAAPIGTSGTTDGTSTGQPSPPADHTDIDATDNDCGPLWISGTSFDPRQVQHLDLTAGRYTLTNPNLGITLAFAVTGDHRVSYDSSLEGIFTGNGTSRLAVHGSRIELDTTDIDYGTAGVGGISQTKDRRHIYRLLPGHYYVVTASGRSPSPYYFDVTTNGHVTYDPRLAGRLTGAGTTVLAIHGFAVTVNVADVDYVQTSVNGTPMTTDRDHVYKLLPGTHYLVANQQSYSFDIGDDGHVTYDPALQGHLTGAGSTTLAVHGFPITIDATHSGQADFTLDGVGRFLASSQRTFRLLPPTERVTLHDGQQYFFQIDAAGNVNYDPSLDHVLSGRGTSTLTVKAQ